MLGFVLGFLAELSQARERLEQALLVFVSVQGTFWFTASLDGACLSRFGSLVSLIRRSSEHAKPRSPDSG